MSRTSLARTTAVVGLAALSVVATVTTASARHGGSDSVQVTAPCGPIATTLVLQARNGGLEVEYQLDQNRNGRTWKLVMTRNGQTQAKAKRTTHAPSGAFSWRVPIAGGASTDAITVMARKGSTVCSISGRVSAAAGSTVTTPAPSSSASASTGTGANANADTIRVTKCFTNATATTGGELLIKADSSDPNATLTAYRPDGSVIGPVQNGGGGRYGGTVMPYQDSDPGTVTIRSSSGGSVTVKTGPFQL